MKRIRLTEHGENILVKCMLNEMGEGDSNLVVFKFLDDNFVRMNQTTTGKDGRPVSQDAIMWLDSNKKPYKAITLDRLFYVVQDEFKSLTADKEQRDSQLKKIIHAWLNKKYNKQTGNILT